MAHDTVMPSDPESAVVRQDNVWQGDVVTLRKFPWQSRGTTWTDAAAMLAAMCIGWTVVAYTPSTNHSLIAMLVVFSAGWAIYEVWSWHDGDRARACLLRSGKLSCTEFAERCLMQPLAIRKRSQWFDTKAWIAAFPGSGDPRTIYVYRRPLAAVPVAPDVFEEIDVLSQRRVSTSAKRRQIALLSYIAAVGLLLVFVGLRSPKVSVSLWLMLALYGFAIVAGLSQIGLAPLQLRSVVASPGKVSCSRVLSEPRVHTRDDSVLIISFRQRFTVVRLCRVDGLMSQFTLLGKPHDQPDLARLLARWCFPNESLWRSRVERDLVEPVHSRSVDLTSVLKPTFATRALSSVDRSSVSGAQE